MAKTLRLTKRRPRGLQLYRQRFIDNELTIHRPRHIDHASINRCGRQTIDASQLQIEAGSGEGPGPPVNNNTEGAVASPPRDDNHNAQLTTPRATPLTPSGKLTVMIASLII
ncbi:unnamed protein product [Euphydryas editha]|uniref:Uncharacterized protein n=1 Tax=Euphydryas editha TaxID=104508 RepID=A0AAU9V4A9_EUPED|nr:unnamed protein product [Euphydryas editha]